MGSVLPRMPHKMHVRHQNVQEQRCCAGVAQQSQAWSSAKFGHIAFISLNCCIFGQAVGGMTRACCSVYAGTRKFNKKLWKTSKWLGRARVPQRVCKHAPLPYHLEEFIVPPTVSGCVPEGTRLLCTTLKQDIPPRGLYL